MCTHDRASASEGLREFLSVSTRSHAAARSFSVSTTRTGVRERAETISQQRGLRGAVLKMPQSAGMEITDTCITAPMIKAAIRAGFPEMPVLKRD